MKIAQVIHGFPPYSTAGSEVYCLNLSRELSRRGHEVIVFHRIADPKKEEYGTEWGEYEDLRVYKINNNFKNCPSFEWTYKNDIIAKKFGAFLDEAGPDVVHFHHVACLSTTCIEEAKKRGLPVVYTLHDYWLICQRGQFLKRDLSLCEKREDSECVRCLAYQLSIRGGAKKVTEVLKNTVPSLMGSSYAKELMRKAYLFSAKMFFGGQDEAIGQIRKRTEHIKEVCSLVDTFIAPSRFLRDKFIEFGIPEEKIVYSDNGFDTALFEGVTRKKSGKIRFGYIGTWIPSKGVHVLIDAFNRVTDSSAELRVYGKYVPYDGYKDYLSDLRSLVRNERIKLLGEYDNRDIGRILSEIDVLVVPSIWYENSPLTIHEAFLSGVPVIASDIGGMAELVRDGVDGLRFRAGDSGDLYRKIKKVIDNPSLLDRLRENIPPVKAIEENAAEIEKEYEGLPCVEVNEGLDFISRIFDAETRGGSCLSEVPYPAFKHKELVARSAFSVNGEERGVLFEHPSIYSEIPETNVLFRGIGVASGDVLAFGIGINEDAWGQPGDGVEFEVRVEGSARKETVFRRYIDPKNNPADRRWFDERVELSPWAGESVDILFKTSAGPRANPEYDWAGWSRPVMKNGPVIRYDFLDRLEDASVVEERRERPAGEDIFYLGNDVRQVVALRGGAELIYRGIKVPEGSRLRLGVSGGFGSGPELLGGLEIDVKAGGEAKKLFSRATLSLLGKRLTGANWYDTELDLNGLGGNEVDFVFRNRSGASKIGLGPLEIVSEKKRRVRRQSVDHTNVLLVTLDAVRGDHLDIKGKRAVKTPNLDRIAAQGISFRNHFTQANVTLPSHLSMLSSKYPSTLRVRDNYRYTLPPLGGLPERLEGAGYRNVAIAGVELLNPDWCRGIDRGFRKYFPVIGNQRMASQTKNIFTNWLLENRRDPFFAWLHLFDAHKPYLPPRPFYGLYYEGNERDKANSSLERLDGLPNITGWLKSHGITDINFPVTQYAAEVSYIDSQLGEVFALMEKLGVLDNTLVVITSDHGECLGEHGVYFDHQGLYDEVMRIPLIMRRPGLLPSGKVLEGLTMNLDIMPTVLELLGMKAGNVEGRSLVPLIKGDLAEVHGHVIAETVHGGQTAMRTKKWKYIKSLKDMAYTKSFGVKKGKVELYDLDADPGEIRNVAAVHPQVARDFEKKLTEWLGERDGGAKAEKLSEDEETRRRLEALGYM